ncbi:hypothetical protein [Spirilliplanes yamanashiensis]|uniref:Uncharacterized protein n=1 Tax=Spirilliplanes yamanashiensis TaxID=42233 RepID=A0A8J4DIZ5_9ACTN|nr:hypothetical protein [Spirilliplanes yamanashiensis]MDP9814820.1 hypothetical protein [Spirilliplanes yamanashiensis]GIJ02475.1 hypothetical protein Sya03_18270 [Spirilliplanes yamanashiensis]
MTSISAGQSRSNPRFPVLGTIAVAAGAVLTWFAWLGWDSQYQVDPATGVSSGPYEAWQVVGCAVTLLALFVGALLAGVRPVPAGAALTVAFTAAWTAHAAATDDTGLYGVGMFMLLIGLGLATTVVGAVTMELRGRWAARRRR